MIRRAIVDPIVYERPRFVTCSAPGGYGKTTLAADIAAQYSSSATCDCSLSDTIGLARNLLQSLRAEDSAVSLEAALEAWRTSAQRADVFVFDNVDALDREGRDFLTACLKTPAPAEMIILCSRGPVHDVLPGRVSPTNIFSVTERDLRFTLDETRTFFGEDLEDETLRRIDDIAQGWPLALALLKRARRKGRLDALLSNPGDAEFSALHGYMAAEILAGLNDYAFHVLCTLAVLGTVDGRDLRHALDDTHPGLIDLVRSLPLVREERGWFSLHPLLSAFLREHHAVRIQRITLAASDAFVRRGDRIRAARVAFDSGNLIDTAALLEQTDVLGSPRALDDAAGLIARLDRATLLRHPRLWNAALWSRFFTLSSTHWFDEARVIWDKLSRDAPLDVVTGVAYGIFHGYAARGKWEDLEAFLDELEGRYRNLETERDRRPLLIARLLRGRMAAIRMEPLDLLDYMRAIKPLIEEDHIYATVLCDVVARVHGALGNRDAQRSALQEAIVRATRCGLASTLAACVHEAAIAAWLAGEDDLFETHVSKLEALIAKSPWLVPGFSHFLDCVRGRAVTAREGSEKPNLRALSWLIAAGRSAELGARRAFIDEAIRTADACRHPRPMIYARLAASIIAPGYAHRWDEAQAIAETLDAPFLHHLFTAGVGAERIEPFLRRFRPIAAPDDRIVVQVLEGRVERRGKPVHFAPKEFALIALLAVCAAPVDSDLLAESLWPDASIASAKASLRVYVNRVRRRLGAEAILVDKGRYRSGSDIATDLQDVETFARNQPRRPTAAEVDLALQHYAALAAGPPAFVLHLPAFASLYAEINLLLELTEQWLRTACERVSQMDRARIQIALEAHALA